MKIGSFLARMVKPFVNVTAWVGYRQVVDDTKAIGTVIKGTFTPETANRIETFEAALKRLNLTEEDVKRQIKIFNYWTIFWLFLGITVFVYAIYMADTGSWYSFVASVSISFVCFTQAFRYNFWVFQMKQRRLGCSIRDWFNGNFMGEKS